MKLVACALISLQLLMSMKSLDAGVCVKPSPPGSTSAAPPPSLSTSNRPTPTDDEGTEESTTFTSISTTGQTTDGDLSSSTAPTTSDAIPTGKPETSTLATTTELPWSPTPTQSTSEKPSTAPGTSSPVTTVSIPTTTGIGVDADTMCRNHPGVEYLPHPYNCHKFIHCSNGIGYIQSCPSNLYWDSRTLTCEATCA